MARIALARWAQAPLISGRLALLFAIVAVGMPTAVRAAVNGVITGCEFTPYLPFVLLSAVLLRWWQAVAVALASTAILGGLFTGSLANSLSFPCFQSSAGIFLGASAMVIGTVVLLKFALAADRRRRAEENSDGLVLSLEAGEVWASWYGSERPVRLGSQRRVCEMMEDFLAQVELGKRLTRY